MKTDTSSIATPTSPHTGAGIFANNENNKLANQHSFQKDHPSCKPQPEEATANGTVNRSTSDLDHPPHTMDQDGEATDGDDVNGETSRSAGGSEDDLGEGTATPVLNKEYVATAKSSTCLIL